MTDRPADRRRLWRGVVSTGVLLCAPVTGSATALAQPAPGTAMQGASALDDAVRRTGDTMIGALHIADPDFAGPISFSVVRTVTGGNTGNPAAFIGDDNESADYQPKYGSIYGGVPALQINRTSGPAANGAVLGVQVNLLSRGDHAYASEDVGYDSHVYKSGQNSTWQFNGETDDSTGLPPAAFAVMGQELDIVANGPDAVASVYDPQQANRRFAYYAAREYPTTRWAASQRIAAGTLLRADDPAGIASVYVALGPGTTGVSPPVWPKSGTVRDGDVTWRYGEPHALTVGTAIWLDDGEDADASYNTGLATNGVFNNAVLDLSKARLRGSNPAAIRLAANQPIDLSANATEAGKNQHVLEFTGSDGGDALVYRHRSETLLSIADAEGWARFTGPVSFSIDHGCRGMTGGFPARGITFCRDLNRSGDETDAVVGAGGLAVYAVSPSGGIPPVPTLSVGPAGSHLTGPLAVAGGLSVSGTMILSGSLNIAVADRQADFSLDASLENVSVDARRGDVFGQLPACIAATRGRHYAVKKLDATPHQVGFRAAGTDRIDGAPSAGVSRRYAVISATCSATPGRWDEGF